ncbi:transcriptional regulator [Halalkalibacterium halodurans]|uniref:transcriptional regulator n=1 Tax=Halalkalibacterium halodurans TaxID=86665 RepID=UPI0010FCEC63|nr:transcriptional regulator [Halalkalibacterium halodurans]
MTSVIKPTKITFKKTEAEWYNYHQTLKEIAKLRAEIMNPFNEEVNDPTVVAGANSVKPSGKPTERMAIRLTTSKQLSFLTEIAEAIEHVYNSLPDNYKQLVRVRYWSGRSFTWEGIAAECNVSKRQAMRWRDDIVLATVELLGWR